MRIEIQKLAAALAHAPYEYIGITPSPAEPPSAPPCALVTPQRSMNAFHYAVEEAKSHWPEAGQMALMGANTLIHEQTPQQLAHGADLRLPPGFEQLQTPVELLTFEP